MCQCLVIIYLTNLKKAFGCQLSFMSINSSVSDVLGFWEFINHHLYLSFKSSYYLGHSLIPLEWIKA